MAYRNGNYSAFYVDEPFSESNLRANTARDFRYYNLLRAWEANDPTFPFVDSHDKTYTVRDSSDWERTLKPRIRERLRNSKNLVLFLSSITRNSRALREEVDYGINNLGLPVIVVYPDFKEKSDIIVCDSEEIRMQITSLWDKLPKFRDSMSDVPTVHVPHRKSLIERALRDKDLMVQTKCDPGVFFYPC